MAARELMRRTPRPLHRDEVAERLHRAAQRVPDGASGAFPDPESEEAASRLDSDESWDGVED
ncbi:MAG: hypothetical protein AAF533_27315 [Acidobacteriota bacterium]